MTFLNSFEAVRYRGIDGLSFPRLARANLITGVNGIGKTAALEAMWLFTGRYNTSLSVEWKCAALRQNGTWTLSPRLAKGALELLGRENDSLHSSKAGFQKVLGRYRRAQGNTGYADTRKPLYGATCGWAHLYGLLDGNPQRKREVGGLQGTPWGSVVFEAQQPDLKRGQVVLS